ncbi:unnamed protein product [Ectocarpus sp. 12 AP-2014]
MRVTPEGEKGHGGCGQMPAKDQTHAAVVIVTGNASAVEAVEVPEEAPIIPSNTPSSVVAQQDPPDRSRCLDALIVALTNTGDGQGWYTPTTQLQLASLDFCTACRAVPTTHVTVDGDVPTRLEAGIDNGGASRVPAFRPRGVTWNLPIAALRGEDDVFADVRVLVLGHGLGRVGVRFNRWVDGLQLPPALQDLTFGQWYDRPIHKVSWPATLRRITFGEAFNQPIDRVSFPESLEELTFGIHFNQPVSKVEFPSSIQYLTFGDEFNQPIEDISWPVSLQELSFGWRFNQPIDNVSWPPRLQALTFSREFQATIDHIEWPDSLKRLTIASPVGTPLPTWPGVDVHRMWRHWWTLPIPAV